MDISKLPEPLRSRAAELAARPAIEKARALLHGHVEDAGDFEEIRASVRSVTRRTTFFVRENLAALETVLADPQEPGTLLRLAEWDANWNMDHDQTDEGARQFLSEVVRVIRETVEEADQSAS
jgi:hypothetical protein